MPEPQTAPKTAVQDIPAPKARHMLRELAHVIRSKSSGKGAVRFDVFFRDAASFTRVRDAGILASNSLAALLGVAEKQIRETAFEDAKLCFRATIDESSPALSQHRPLLDALIP